MYRIMNTEITSEEEKRYEELQQMALIHFAAMFGRYEVVKILETYGTSLHRKNNKTRFRIMPLLARWIGNVRRLFCSK